VANGGTLVGLAKMYSLRFSDLTKAIRLNPDYQKKYEQALKDRAEWTVEALTEIITQLKNFDVRLLYDENGGMLPPQLWPEEISIAVSGITKDGVKLVDKTKAIDMLGKHIKYFVENINHSGSISLEDLVIGSYGAKTTDTPDT
jgi:hypothetical protein